MEPVVRLVDVERVYRLGEVELKALAGVSLEVPHGQLVAIVGASGSGKSTLMNVIGCLDRPTAGRYFLDGKDVSTLGRAQLAGVRNRTLGFVFQSFNLLARTSAVENVELPLVYGGLGGKERRRRATEALVQVGLGDRLDHQPTQLSGGQQQRVAIARALVNRPRVLLADEPTGALDSKTSVEVMTLLVGLVATGITVILVTHSHEVAQVAQRVLTMRDGKIIADQLQQPRSPGEVAA